jgi:hypothetical protein
VAGASYHGQHGNLVDTAERSSVLNQAYKYEQASNHPFMQGVGKGLLKLTPPGIAVSTVAGVAAAVAYIHERGLMDAMSDALTGIGDIPANLRDRLNSPDPTVRGEALVDVLALGAGVGAATAGGTRLLLSQAEKIRINTALAKAEADALAKKRVDNNVLAEGASSTPAGLNTSAGVIPANPHKTTTVLGRFSSDMDSVVNQQMFAVKTEDFGARPGGFNILNIDDAKATASPDFFKQYNEPFLDAALGRGDDIALATIPQKADDVMYSNGQLKGSFAKELEYLVQKDYKPVNLSPAQWKIMKGWFK